MLSKESSCDKISLINFLKGQKLKLSEQQP